jgi:hypothetical protein
MKLGLVVASVFLVSFGPFIILNQLPQVINNTFQFYQYSNCLTTTGVLFLKALLLAIISPHKCKKSLQHNTEYGR